MREARAYLLEIEVLSPADVAATLYLSDVPVPPFAPDDEDRPNQDYDPRLIEAPSVSSDLYADPARLTGGIGIAEALIGNSDGGLNAYRGWAFGACRLYWGVIGAEFKDYTLLLTGRAESPLWRLSATSQSRLAVPIYDRRLALEADMLTATYAGSNVADVGYEGGEDMEDSLKPLALGDLTTGNLPAPWVNAPRQVMQVHDGPMQGDVTVFDRGADAGLSYEGDETGSSFDALVLSADEYATDAARGLVLLKSGFGGIVTLGCKGAVWPGALGYQDAAPGLLEGLLSRLDPAATIGSSIATLRAAETAKAGLWLSQQTRYRQGVDELARCWLGWVLPDPTGAWQAGPLTAPAGSPSLVLGEADIAAISVDDPIAGIPAWKVTVRGGRLYHTHGRGDLAGSLFDTEDETRLKREWIEVVRFDQAVKDRWPDARELVLEVPLRYRADIEALAEAALTLFGPRSDGTPRESYLVETEMTEALVEAVTTEGLGALEIRVEYPRQDVAQDMILVGYRWSRPRRNRALLRVWG